MHHTVDVDEVYDLGSVARPRSGCLVPLPAGHSAGNPRSCAHSRSHCTETLCLVRHAADGDDRWNLEAGQISCRSIPQGSNEDKNDEQSKQGFETTVRS